MKSRQEFTQDNSIKFIAGVLADDFDNKTIQLYKKDGPSPKSLLIDFAEATYIDPATLINLTAFFIRRKEKQQRTYLGIPKEKKVRDFLRLWRFPEAFFDATGTRFVDALISDDQKYRGESQTTYTGIGSGLDALINDRDWKPDTYSKRNFFEFCSYFLTPQQGSLFSGPIGMIPRVEGNRWNGALIREVLNTHLISKRPTDDVARVVIYESLSNAVRHPSANIIQIASKFHRLSRQTITSKDPQQKSQSLEHNGHLQIYIWDDGESIADTLAPLLRVGKPIRTQKLMEPYMYDKIHLQIREHGKKSATTLIVDQYEDPSSDAPEELILLSSLFPGVSRTISEIVEDVLPFDETNEGGQLVSWAQKQGMGLYALTKTVLDLYQGSLFIRSGTHRLVIELAHDAYRSKYGVRYKSKITRYPNRLPKFKGNLLIIEIPIWLNS